MDEEETWTAYHEAGHAVIAFALGGEVDWMQLGGEADQWLPERYGDCRINWGKIDPNCDWQLQRELLAILAGPVAEMVYRGGFLDPARYGPWQSDWEHAWNACERFASTSGDRLQFLRHVIQYLRQQMQDKLCWAAIAAVADELVAHETLEAEQVEEVLGFWLR